MREDKPMTEMNAFLCSLERTYYGGHDCIQQDFEVVRWGLQLFEGDPCTDCGYCNPITPDNVDFYGGHYIVQNGYTMDCGDIESNELIAQALQEELSQLAVVETTDSADEGSEHLQPFPETWSWRLWFLYTWKKDRRKQSICLFAAETRRDITGSNHTPKPNGEIPPVDEATLDHQRLLERLQLYG
ncbi:hypothetical protein MLD38_008289 [Melastoma candidum]|uniref:Uncharacterized protein n=1 Tax=Melastoma candidum TaxID=119954 RepID=A0ACB9RUD2_9MYRT|nr:hypothetical protein MLD38_008289 [Melastoma candidum]